MKAQPAKDMEIRKADASLEAFSPAKLQRCVASLLHDCGFDSRLAAPLARAVTLHVQQLDGGEPTTTRYVFQCVHAVLSQTGLADAAEALREHRERRERARRQLATYGPACIAPWERRRVSRTLETEFGLGRATARFLSGEIERKVLRLECRFVSEELLTALMRNELCSWGLLGEPLDLPVLSAASDAAASAGKSEEDRRIAG